MKIPGVIYKTFLQKDSVKNQQFAQLIFQVEEKSSFDIDAESNWFAKTGDVSAFFKLFSRAYFIHLRFLDSRYIL